MVFTVSFWALDMHIAKGTSTSRRLQQKGLGKIDIFKNEIMKLYLKKNKENIALSFLDFPFVSVFLTFESLGSEPH